MFRFTRMAEADISSLSSRVRVLTIESPESENLPIEKELDSKKEKLHEIAMVCCEYFEDEEEGPQIMKQIVLKKPRGYNIDFVSRNGTGRLFRDFESIIIDQITKERDVVIFLGMFDVLELNQGPRKHQGPKRDLFQDQMTKFLYKVQDLIEGKSGSKIIFVGMVPGGPLIRSLQKDMDAINGYFSALAYTNPERVGYRGFNKEEFDRESEVLFDATGCILTRAGERKIGNFFREIFDALVENRENQKPLNEWPVFKLPKRE